MAAERPPSRMSDLPSDPSPPPSDRERPLRVGWKEYLDLPGLGLHRVKAKMDTGARTSALHVLALNVLEQLPDGTAEVELSLAPDRRHPERRRTARAHLLGHVRVTDSGGHPEVRPLIETELVLGPVRKRIALTLTDRAGMLFRMIVGRKALEGDFLVDVAHKYLLRRWHPRRRAPRNRNPRSEAGHVKGAPSRP
jgi:hypothetical protein